MTFGCPLSTLARAAAVAVPLLAAACDSPKPFSDFAGVPATRLEVDGSSFTVRVAGNRAQAVRTNFDAAALRNRGRHVIPRAGLAMERASGCRVVPGSLTGDAALIEARLDC